jgi:outer membrane protein OmpA-like peptidoglycan-associated protein
MNNTVRIAIATLILTGCASAPPRDTALENARSEVDALSQQPLAQQAAADDLSNARRHLQAGDSALQQHLPLAVVDHDAYLASRSAQAGEARVEEAQAKAQITAAQTERQAILLHSRGQEADIAKSQADAARQQAESAHQQADNAKLQADAAKEQLAATQQQLADLQAKKTDRGMVLTLGDVLFDTAQAALKPGATSIMDRVAAFMNDNPTINVRIEGHTDSTGSPDFNQVLSQNRAAAAAVALQTRGVSSNRITAVGKGQELPVASNTTSAGRQQNRRVEIVFSDNAGQFARVN